jgi:hypothetical protein
MPGNRFHKDFIPFAIENQLNLDENFSFKYGMANRTKYCFWKFYAVEVTIPYISRVSPGVLLNLNRGPGIDHPLLTDGKWITL